MITSFSRIQHRLHGPSRPATPRIERVFKNRELPNSKYPQRRTRRERTKISSQKRAPQRKHVVQHFLGVATSQFRGLLERPFLLSHDGERGRWLRGPYNSAFGAHNTRTLSIHPGAVVVGKRRPLAACEWLADYHFGFRLWGHIHAYDSQAESTGRRIAHQIESRLDCRG